MSLVERLYTKQMHENQLYSHGLLYPFYVIMDCYAGLMLFSRVKWAGQVRFEGGSSIPAKCQLTPNIVANHSEVFHGIFQG